MMMNNSISLLRKAGAALVGVAALVTLSSCDDEKETAKENETPAAQPAENASATAATEAARNALLEDLLFGVGKSLTDGVTDRTFTYGVPSPECWDKMCVLLEELETYYQARAAQAAGSMEVARLATRVAQMRASLVSPKALESYQAAQTAFDAMKDADKNSDQGKELLCSIKEGTGVLLLGQGKSEEALPVLQQVQDLRKEALFKLVPQAEIPNISESLSHEVSEAASAAMRAATVVAVCKSRMGDSAEAKKVLTEASELTKTFPRVTPRMRLQYARLMSTLGDLERVGGDAEAALRAWREAAGNVANVLQQYKDSARSSAISSGYTVEAQGLYNSLAKAIKMASDELQEAESEGAEGETPAEGQEQASEPEPAATPDALAIPEASQPVAEPEAAKPAPAPTPAKPANNRGRRRW